MDDTHDPSAEDTDVTIDAISDLAKLDPAEAPPAAEALAADLAGELESAGAAAPQPTQPNADRSDS